MIRLPDRFMEALPTEFSDGARLLWSAAQKLASEDHSSCVVPRHFFGAWLATLSVVPAGLTFDRLREAEHSLLRRRPAQPGYEGLKPEALLFEAFTVALGDSYRFTGCIDNVDYRWIIPNLLNPRLVLATRIKELGLDIVDTFVAVLQTLGDPFPDLYGHYAVRYTLLGGTRARMWLASQQAKDDYTGEPRAHAVEIPITCEEPDAIDKDEPRAHGLEIPLTREERDVVDKVVEQGGVSASTWCRSIVMEAARYLLKVRGK